MLIVEIACAGIVIAYAVLWVIGFIIQAAGYGD